MRGFPYHELGGDLTMEGGPFPLFEHGVDSVDNKSHRRSPHGLHRLADSRQGWAVERACRDIVKSNDRTLLGNMYTGLGESADGAEGRHVIKREDGGEGALLLDQVFCEFIACLEARNRIARFGQVDNQTGIKFQAARFGKIANALPAWGAVGQRLRTADKGDLAMAQ